MVLKLCYAKESMTNEGMDKPEAIWRPHFFKVGDIKNVKKNIIECSLLLWSLVLYGLRDV